MSLSRRPRLAGAALVALLAAGCGSTVPLAAGPGTTGAVTADGGLTVPGPTAPDGGVTPGGVGATVGAGDGGVTTGPASSSAAAPGGGASTGPVGGGTDLAPGTPSGPGITDTVINVGLAQVDDPNAGNDTLGIAGARVHNLAENVKPVIDYVNRHGGVAGRQLKLHVYTYSNSADANTLYQSICEHFTTDTKVFTVLASGGDQLDTCWEKHGMPTFTAQQVIGDVHATFRKFPHVLSITAFDMQTQATATLGGLRSHNYFSGWDPRLGTAATAAPYVGVVTFDTPNGLIAVKQSYMPLLKAYGIHAQAAFVAANYNDGPAQLAAIVQKFKAEGVSHVVFLDNSGGILALLWSIEANSQAYYPRLGCDTGSCNQIVANQMPAPTLRGAVLTGWSPLNDVPPSRDVDSPARKQCRQIMATGNAKPYSRNDENVQANDCDMVLFFAAALDHAGPVLTADTAIAGSYAVGRSFSPANVFAAQITPERHAGGLGYRMADWDPTCGGDNGGTGCFHYTSPLARIE